MPTRLQLSDFAGGIRRDLNTQQIPINATTDCANVDIHTGAIAVRGGRVVHSALPSDTLTVGARDIVQYVPPANFTDPVTRFVCVVGDKLYATDSTTQTFSTSVKLNTTLTSATCQVRFQQFGAYFYFVDGVSSVKKCFGQEVDNTLVTTLTGKTRATIPCTVSSSTSGTDVLLSGDYYCCYKWSHGGNDSMWSEPIRYSLSTGTTAKSLIITVPSTAWTQADTDVLSFIVKSPYRLDEWVLCDQRVILGGVIDLPQHLDFISTTVTSSTGSLEPALETPPLGCSNLIEWQSRMVYVGAYPYDTTGADTLYISDLSNPESCRVKAVIDPADDMGTFVRVGSDGLPITAMARIGSYLFVAKNKGCWLLDGYSPATFSLRQVSSSIGCVNQNTLAYTPNGIIFVSDQSVISFDGSTFGILSEPVKSILDASATHLNAAHAVYDPILRKYHLVFEQ